jgi:hypothetical protein
MMLPLMNEMINVNAHEMQCTLGSQTPGVLQYWTHLIEILGDNA